MIVATLNNSIVARHRYILIFLIIIVWFYDMDVYISPKIRTPIRTKSIKDHSSHCRACGESSMNSTDYSI